MERLRADFLVAGAGPAGLTTARLLALKGRKVIVVDPGARQPKRLELLAPSSLGTVAAVGLAPLLDDPAVARPCLGIRRTPGAAESAEYDDFLRHPRRTGYVVDRLRFDARLREAAACADVEFRRLRVTGVAPDGQALRVQTERSTTAWLAFSGVVIDATGRAAMIARRKGARITMRDRLVAELVDETTVEEPDDAPSWLDYQSDASGWAYRIRGPGGHTQTWRVRRHGTTGGRALFRVDASAGILSEAAGEGWLAVGDAAISFDPITSQGLFNALSSALVAAGALLSAGGLGPVSTRSYCDAITTTFLRSEMGRSSVYSTMQRIGL